MTLKYPSDLNTSDVDWVSFTAHEYKSNASGASGPQVGQPISLYMPTSTPGMANKNSYGSVKFEGSLGVAVRDAAMIGTKAVGDITGGSDAKGAVDAIVSRFGDNMSNIPSAVNQLGVGAIASMAGIDDPNQLQALTSGEIYNPNIELLYKGPGLRDFSMMYVFAPKSEQEAAEVNQIIKEFKTRSSAAKTGNNMLKVPNVFQITYMSGNGPNRNYNQFKKAALVNIVVQQNPGLPLHTSFANGMPVLTKIMLQFQEVDVILRDDHTSSFSNIGY
ncbi:baseplate wedge protein, inner [Synechococcus phage S-CREM2]|nr:baseplate wedge protein, inner [Synechococcus phage S-CREM2]